MEDVFIILDLFGSMYGVFYLHYNTRNRERMALIEKGADASIFFTKKSKRNTPVWKVLILNLALLLMGVGVGVVVGATLGEYSSMEMQVTMPGSIFFFAGSGLLIGYFISRNFDKEN
jgi:polyferredoxin